MGHSPLIDSVREMYAHKYVYKHNVNMFALIVWAFSIFQSFSYGNIPGICTLVYVAAYPSVCGCIP